MAGAKKSITLDKPQQDTSPKQKLSDKPKCTCCGKPTNDYYLSQSDLYKHIGRLTICKICVDNLYERILKRFNYDTDKAIYYLCMKLDMPFHQSALTGAKGQIEKSGGKLNRIYITKINSFREANFYADNFLDSEKLVSENNDTNKNGSNNITTGNTPHIEEEYESVEIEYLKIKWGSELLIDDLIWLEQKYNEWYDNYDIQGKAMELLIQQLCFEELYIYKDRQTGKDVSKRLKNIQDMMKSSKLSPRQETASETAEFQTIAEFIKKVEQKKPFVKENPEFNDPDKFKKMWMSMSGALSRTIGKPDENTQAFDEFFKDSTMDLSNITHKDGE